MFEVQACRSSPMQQHPITDLGQTNGGTFRFLGHSSRLAKENCMNLDWP
ncbi:unnamed protein product [Calypogeia fissa]